MKTKRRQELRTNELAQALAQLREFYQKHAAYVWVGTMAVVVVLAGGMLWHRSTVGRVEEAWDRFYAAAQTLQQSAQQGDILGDAAQGAMSQLRELADGAPDGRLMARARLTLGEVYWLWAMQPDSDSATASRYLDEAMKNYERVLEQGRDSLAAALATVSMAAIAENERRFDLARELYRKAADDPAVQLTGVEVLAAQALDRLKTDPEVLSFPPRPVQTQPATTQPQAQATELPAVLSPRPPVTTPPAKPTTTTPPTTQPAGF